MKNNETSMKKLLDYINGKTWSTFSKEVQNQSVKCFLDLAGVIIAGAKNNTSKKAAAYVSDNYPLGDCTILSNGKKTNLIGAALANGMSANALDLDDGFSLLRGHPGAGFFGALLSAAEYSKCTYGEFLTALIISYEVSIRQGFAIRDFYKWDHSSGCYSAFGTAAGVAKLLKLSEEETEMALGIADFIAPLNPAKRSCYIPSMNKDGIYWGQHTGVQAVMMAKSGITGKNPVLCDDTYNYLVDSLDEKYYFFDLYIKFHSCCRWVHSPIRAIKALRNKYEFDLSDIAKIDVYSFGYAGTLYKEAPKCEDEAEYNIKYPIAATLLFGECGPIESSTDKMLDSRIPSIIEKIRFYNDPNYDKEFPAKRKSRVELTLNNGKTIISDTFEPEGDVNSEVTIEDLIKKVYDINKHYATKQELDCLIDKILNTSYNDSFDKIYSVIKELALNNINPKLVFI